MAEASDFKFGTQLGFAKAHHKITFIGKSGRGLVLGKLPYILGSPLIFLQRPRCPLSVSGASCILKFQAISKKSANRKSFLTHSVDSNIA